MIGRVVKILSLATIVALPAYVVRFNLGPIPSTVLEILLLATVAVWGIEGVKNITLKPRVFYFLLFTFLLAATIGIFIAPNTRAALGLWRAYFIEPILFFLVIFDLLKTKKITAREIIAALGISALAISTYAVFQRVTGHGIPHPWDTERRVTSVFPFPNAVGLFLAPLVPLFLSRISKKDLQASCFYILTTILSTLAIYFAHSMGAIVGVAAGLGVALLIYCIQNRSWKLFVGFLLATAVASSVVFTQPTLQQELLLKDWSGTVRKIGWKESVAMLKDHPIFGAGLSGFPVTLAPYHKATFLEIFQHPHNIVLNFWSEIGLLGLVSFVGLLIYFFSNAFKNRGSPFYVLGSIGAMTAIVIHGLVDVPYLKNDLAVVFWLIYALSLEID